MSETTLCITEHAQLDINFSFSENAIEQVLDIVSFLSITILVRSFKIKRMHIFEKKSRCYSKIVLLSRPYVVCAYYLLPPRFCAVLGVLLQLPIALVPQVLNISRSFLKLGSRRM